jgi:hypothetical protein
MPLQSASESHTTGHVKRDPITTGDQSLLAHERDFERWRVAVNLVQRLREAGISCELRGIAQTHN